MTDRPSIASKAGQGNISPGKVTPGRMRAGTLTTRIQAKSKRDSFDEEELVGDEGDERKGALNDFDWSIEEQQSVLKFYTLDSLFPAAWGEDNTTIMPTPTLESGHKDDSDFTVKQAMEQETSDPLRVKDKIVKRPKISKRGEGASVFISEKTFSPRTFLLEVHKGTDYKQLEQGAVRLRQSIAERSDATRGLVKKHFAKFVNAKSTVDSFYKEMKNKNLISKEEYGVAPFMDQLSALEGSATSLYGPVLERRLKAARIRITLSILEQWKFFFNLASSISEMVRKGRYDAAVRDYRKGKHVMRSSFWSEEQKEVRTDKFGKDSSNLLPKNYQSVFEKLWMEVEHVVTGFRDELFKSLRVMTNPVETQEKIMTYLVELDSKRDPVWCYLDSQYNWVLDNLVKVYQSHIGEMKGLLKKLRNKGSNEDGITHPIFKGSMDNLSSSEYLTVITDQSAKSKSLKDSADQKAVPIAWTLNDVKKALLSVTTQSFESEFGHEILVRFWKQTFIFVQSLCNVLQTHLPVFWKTCKLYVDGKSHKAEHAKRANAQKRLRDGQAMMTNIFEIIQTMINYSFFLNFEEEEDEDEDDDEDELKSSIIETPNILQPKDLSSYASNTGVDADDNQDSDAVWKTFQNVAGSLEKLPPAEFKQILMAHPLVISHFSTRIMELLQNCLGSIRPFYSGEEGVASLESLAATIDTVKGCLVHSICEGWIRTSKSFHFFEDWTFENNNVGGQAISKGKLDSTFLTKLYNRVSKFILRALVLVVGNTVEVSNSSSFLDFSSESLAGYIEKIRVTIFESSLAMLDGFHYQISQWRDPQSAIHFEDVSGWVPQVVHSKLKSVMVDQKSNFGVFAAPECSNYVETVKLKDFRNLEARIFMTLCNIIYAKTYLVPTLSQLFESHSQVEATLDIQYYMETSTILERLAIQNYSRRQGIILKSLIKTAIFYSGIDWSSHRAPHEIRPYCFQILHHFVYIHASISEVSKSLVQLVLCDLVLLLAQELLMAIRQVDRFNIPGMLQATLETDFLDSTLKSFESQKSMAIFLQIYETLERATDKEVKMEPTRMNEHLTSVKAYLNEAKAATFTQFRCFASEI